ncbi:hypothetical protein BS50DRAFT_641372 [Corynespora cassiicola Philippines]|uniref:NB-ARC domain-containing protein n=1 Tax=Corynespora cassiicola Philippines TaxID=1448308 RepID=A0A2T2N105_CORCC|nr:hypothetical protein BS50DRAFT_641372 [Corynespora cassiicola Philippines]
MAGSEVAAGRTEAYFAQIITEGNILDPQCSGVAKRLQGYETRRLIQAVSMACHLPFSKNRYFVGRRDELEELQEKLLMGQDCKKVSIVGLGGTGKTQVALQFAYVVKETHPEICIFWLPALNMASFEQACIEIAQTLHIPLAAGEGSSAKELVKQHLSAGRAGRWLLVVDNADDADVMFGKGQSKGIIDYLPESEGGVTIYTTCKPDVAVLLTHNDVLELGAMSRSDAADFLEKSLIWKELLRDSTATSQLLDELAYVPLAIAQAAAYLNMNKTPIARYLRLLQSTEQDTVSLMSREFCDDTRYQGSANAVATTWMMSFKQLETRDTAATELLAFISCIEWKAIPRAILPKTQPEHRMEEAIGALCGLSFLVRRENGDCQKEVGKGGGEEEEGRGKGKGEMDEGGIQEWIWLNKHGDAADKREAAVQHVTNAFPSDDYRNRELWRAYLPHALRLLENTQGYAGEAKSKLSLRVGRCLQIDGRIREAVRWIEKCCEWRRNVLAKDDSERLLSEHVLAIAYQADGQVKKAVDLLEKIVETQEVLAKEHPSRLASQHALAMAYRIDGQVKKAVDLLEKIVGIREEVLVKEHPSRLASQHALAMAYRADGQVKKAVGLLEKVVEIREEVLVKEHPSRLVSQHELAGAYRADGQTEQAIELMEYVVAVDAHVYRANHPSRLASIQALNKEDIEID